MSRYRETIEAVREMEVLDCILLKTGHRKGDRSVWNAVDREVADGEKVFRFLAHEDELYVVRIR